MTQNPGGLINNMTGDRVQASSITPADEENAPTDPNDDMAKDEAKGAKEEPPAWIRYRIDYRDLRTDELLHHDESTEPDSLEHFKDTSGELPAFELIKTIKTRSRGTSKDAESDQPRRLASTVAPTYSIRIYSESIINAIQSVVRYYPQHNFNGDSEGVLINWPYAILCHHYDELSEFVEKCKSKDMAQLCVREKRTATEVPILLDFLDVNVMPHVREERERSLRGMHTFEWLWVSYRPGQTLMERTTSTADWQAKVVHSVYGGTFSNGVRGRDQWIVYYWTLASDGTSVGRTISSVAYDAFDGEFEMDARFLETNDDKEIETEDEDLEELIRQGGIYWEALEKQCRWYEGPTASFPHNHISALVMVDIQAYLTENPDAGPDLLEDTDCRRWTTDCICSVCQENETKASKAWSVMFQQYNDFTHLQFKDGLPWHMRLLLPKKVYGFVFRTRAWEELHVAKCSIPQYDKDMIDYLVMDAVQLARLKALALAYARKDRHGNKMTQSSWSADFVRGKGNGLTFLLHGKPGVGKTCTAECIAEFTHSPLMVLTSSDIGTDPRTVEINLTREFKKAKSWGAVLLIDEADVFMERRSTRDLVRNSLVAGFLRALEFYDGILFLTTNRVGAFDDAFISRIHVQLYYADFTDIQRQQIWQTFVDKLHRERGNSMRLNIDAKEYLKGADLRAIKWNGREIRNAFQTAVSLAEYDAEKDEEGKTVVTDQHLRAVVELSKDFKDYLKDLHKGDEGKRAALRSERVDDFAME